MNGKKNFYVCEMCGKKLIERLPNGLWKFVFGRNPEDMSKPPVKMLIRGSLKMNCLRRTCSHDNILPYFPQSADFQEEDKSISQPE